MIDGTTVQAAGPCGIGRAGWSPALSRRLAAFALLLLAGLAGSVLAGVAWAQSARDHSVMLRPRPEFEPLCIPSDLGLLGDERDTGFLICPRLHTALGFDDNVFRTDEARESDLFTTISPQVAIRSDWENHALRLIARGDITRYADLTNNDWEDFEVRGRGRLDIREDLHAVARGSYGRFHEERGDPDAAPGTAGVNQYYRGHESLQLNYLPTDLEFRLEASATQIDWQDNGPIDNDDRDRDEYRGLIRAGMEFHEEFMIFGEASYNIRRYRRGRDSAGFERDSQGFDVRAGVLYDVTGLTFLEASVGYFQQDFEDPRFVDADGVSARVDMTWNATELATVNLTAERSVEETTQLNVSSIVQTRATLGLDYEVAYNLLADSGVTYRRDDFKGVRRTDDVWVGRVGLTYLMNEYLSLNAAYTYSQRDSNVAGADFSSNTFLVTLRGQL